MPDRRPDRLYHFTCDHAAERIREDGFIKPATMLHPVYAMIPRELQAIAKAAGSLCWFTDLERPPSNDTLGLTMLSIRCDRMQYCFEVIPDWGVIRWWMRARRQHKDLWQLEEHPGVLPAHWFVSEHPVKVLAEVT
jgi:hypothetical protein